MEILGSSNADLLNKFIEALIKSDTGIVLQIIDELSGLGKSMGVLIRDVTSVIRDLLVVKTCVDSNAILGLPMHKFEKLSSLAKIVSEERLLRVLTIFSDAENTLKYSNHPRIVFETAAVKATRPDADYDIDALLLRIKQLEDNINKGDFLAERPINSVADSSSVKIETQRKQESFIYDVSEEEIKGKILLHLRKINSEMLWNIFQAVKLKIDGNLLKLTISNKEDLEFLDTDLNRAKIFEALKEYQKFNLEIKLSEAEKNLEEIDEAAERMKKIFGDNIVIIK